MGFASLDGAGLPRGLKERWRHFVEVGDAKHIWLAGRMLNWPGNSKY